MGDIRDLEDEFLKYADEGFIPDNKKVGSFKNGTKLDYMKRSKPKRKRSGFRPVKHLPTERIS